VSVLPSLLRAMWHAYGQSSNCWIAGLAKQTGLTYAKGPSIIRSAMKLPDDIRKFFQQQGRIGAAKRIAMMSPAERRANAKRAAQIRWKNERLKREKSKPEEKS
jgi:hypothetical protein